MENGRSQEKEEMHKHRTEEKRDLMLRSTFKAMMLQHVFDSVHFAGKEWTLERYQFSELWILINFSYSLVFNFMFCKLLGDFKLQRSDDNYTSNQHHNQYIVYFLSQISQPILPLSIQSTCSVGNSLISITTD